MSTPHKLNIVILFLVMLFAAVAAVSAADISFTVEANAIDANGTLFVASSEVSELCSSLCEYSMPVFDVPQDYTVSNYTIDYVSTSYDAYFSSNHEKLTVNSADTITVEVTPPPTPTPEPEPEPEPALVCKDDHCDRGCESCSDGSCHEPGFECVEELSIERMFPNSTKIGETQLNILIRNSGTVGLSNVYALVSGDGITVIEKIPISYLAGGDKDYAFVKINASKPGSIDLVVKLFAAGKLKKTVVEQIAVAAEKVDKPAVKEDIASDGPDVKEVSERLDTMKDKFRVLEQDYLDKKTKGYGVETVYDSLKKAQDYLINAQSYLFEGDYRRALANLEISEELLTSVEEQLAVAKKQEVKFSDKLRNNMIYVGSIAAALVSSFTAYGFIKSNINKQKIVELKDKLKRERQVSRVPAKKMPKKKSEKKVAEKPIAEAKKQEEEKKE
jgi:hypothetical protein